MTAPDMRIIGSVEGFAAPEPHTSTRAQEWQAEQGKGIWRTARKTRRCRPFWRRPSDCAGDGTIAAGERYFDLQELNGEAGGFGTHQTCAACANEKIAQ